MYTMAVLGIFCPKIIWDKLNFRYQGEKKIWNNKGFFVIPILKDDNTN